MDQPYRLLITGSRTWTNRSLIHQVLLQIHKLHPQGKIVLIHGAARGVDSLAAEFAQSLGWDLEAHPALHPKYKERNQGMVNRGADLCLAFAESWSSGTGQTARMARRAGIPVIDYGVETRE